MNGQLYLIPNLLAATEPTQVLPQTVIDCVRKLRHFAVETPKIARAFLKTLEMPVAISELAMCEIPAAQISLSWLAQGHDVGVVSDAGCPGVADPGAQLVALAHQGGYRVIPYVGPSSILLALMASGLNGQQFRFHGYLPTEVATRNAKLRELDARIHKEGETQIFIETPYRNGAMLDALLQQLSAETVLCAAQGLTGVDEIVISKKKSQWSVVQSQRLSQKVPTIFLLGRWQ